MGGATNYTSGGNDDMEKDTNYRMVLGVSLGVGLTVLIIIIIFVVIVCLRIRRNRRALTRRSTLRPDSVINTLDVETVDKPVNYRQSRDPFHDRAGDIDGSLKELKPGDIGVAKAPPPPLGVPPPPIVPL